MLPSKIPLEFRNEIRVFVSFSWFVLLHIIVIILFLQPIGFFCLGIVHFSCLLQSVCLSFVPVLFYSSVVPVFMFIISLSLFCCLIVLFSFSICFHSTFLHFVVSYLFWSCLSFFMYTFMHGSYQIFWHRYSCSRSRN